MSTSLPQKRKLTDFFKNRAEPSQASASGGKRAASAEARGRVSGQDETATPSAFQARPSSSFKTETAQDSSIHRSSTPPQDTQKRPVYQLSSPLSGNEETSLVDASFVTAWESPPLPTRRARISTAHDSDEGALHDIDTGTHKMLPNDVGTARRPSLSSSSGSTTSSKSRKASAAELLRRFQAVASPTSSEKKAQPSDVQVTKHTRSKSGKGDSFLSVEDSLSSEEEELTMNVQPSRHSDDRLEGAGLVPQPITAEKMRSTKLRSARYLEIPPATSKSISSPLSTARSVASPSPPEGPARSPSDHEPSSPGDSNDDSSDSDLEDVEALLATTKKKVTSATFQSSVIDSMTPNSLSATTQKFRTSGRSGLRRRGDLYTYEAPEVKGRFSLAKLLAENKREDASRDRLARMDDADESEDGDDRGDGSGPTKPNSGARSPQDLSEAFQRASVGDIEMVYDMFPPTISKPSYPPNPFPIAAVIGTRWEKPLKCSKDARDASFLSGFVESLMQVHSLPHKVVAWMWSEVFSEPNELLVACYRDILRVLVAQHRNSSPDSKQHSPAFEHTRLDAMLDMFRSYGCRVLNSDCLKPFEGLPTTELGHREMIPTSFERCLQLMQISTSILEKNDLAKLCPTVLGLCLDRRLSNDIRMAQTCSEVLFTIINESCEGETGRTLSSVFSPAMIPNTALQVQALASIKSTSRSTSCFKQNMAIRFFMHHNGDDEFQNCRTANVDPSNLVSDPAALYQALLQHLSCSAFHPSPSTNYAYLCARIELLIIALGTSYVPHSAFPHNKPLDTKVAAEEPSKSEKELHKQHNTNLDALASRLRAINALILDPGGLHPARSATKAALERCIFCCENGLRTRPARGRDVFAKTFGAPFTTASGTNTPPFAFGDTNRGQGSALRQWLQRT